MQSAHVRPPLRASRGRGRERECEEDVPGPSSGMMVLLVKQVHLQKEVGAVDGVSGGWRGTEMVGGRACGEDGGGQGEEDEEEDCGGLSSGHGAPRGIGVVWLYMSKDPKMRW